MSYLVDTNVLGRAVHRSDAACGMARRAILGYSPDRVRRYLAHFESLFSVLFETDYSITGMEAHDTRLVAAMLVHNVENIVTFNVDDFKGYSGINVISPITLAV